MDLADRAAVITDGRGGIGDATGVVSAAPGHG